MSNLFSIFIGIVFGIIIGLFLYFTNTRIIIDSKYFKITVGSDNSRIEYKEGEKEESVKNIEETM